MTHRSMREYLVELWYRRSPLAYALLPIALVYRAACALRSGLYRAGLLRSVHLRAPVIVIGNITVGGTGKTPLTLWLAAALSARGWSPGIVCRSYRANARVASPVQPTDDAQERGDEAVMLAARRVCPVWSGPNKAATARALLAAHPTIDVLICDDGLQHYALARDVEIAVIDAERGLGNRMPLPAGPLRDPPSRLATVDAIVVNGEQSVLGLPSQRPRFIMRLEGDTFRALKDPAQLTGPARFAGKKIAAIAGIGHPNRFFDDLRALGLQFVEHAFADHHRYSASDLQLAEADVILMTEKDGIKCAALADGRMWVLPVSATLDAGLVELVSDRIGTPRASHMSNTPHTPRTAHSAHSAHSAHGAGSEQLKGDT